jgi:hypothetical protein
MNHDPNPQTHGSNPFLSLDWAWALDICNFHSDGIFLAKYTLQIVSYTHRFTENPLKNSQKNCQDFSCYF